MKAASDRQLSQRSMVGFGRENWSSYRVRFYRLKSNPTITLHEVNSCFFGVFFALESTPHVVVSTADERHVCTKGAAGVASA